MDANATFHAAVATSWFHQQRAVSFQDAAQMAADSHPIDYTDLCVYFPSTSTAYWLEEAPAEWGLPFFIFLCVVASLGVLISLVLGIFLICKKWDGYLTKEDRAARGGFEPLSTEIQ